MEFSLESDGRTLAEEKIRATEFVHLRENSIDFVLDRSVSLSFCHESRVFSSKISQNPAGSAFFIFFAKGRKRGGR
jgi:hypothetical protein